MVKIDSCIVDNVDELITWYSVYYQPLITAGACWWQRQCYRLLVFPVGNVA